MFRPLPCYDWFIYLFIANLTSFTHSLIPCCPSALLYYTELAHPKFFIDCYVFYRYYVFCRNFNIDFAEWLYVKRQSAGAMCILKDVKSCRTNNYSNSEFIKYPIFQNALTRSCFLFELRSFFIFEMYGFGKCFENIFLYRLCSGFESPIWTKSSVTTNLSCDTFVTFNISL